MWEVGERRVVTAVALEWSRAGGAALGVVCVWLWGHRAGGLPWFPEEGGCRLSCDGCGLDNTQPLQAERGEDRAGMWEVLGGE